MGQKRKWICFYINGNGDNQQKVFHDLENDLKFTRILISFIDKALNK